MMTLRKGSFRFGVALLAAMILIGPSGCARRPQGLAAGGTSSAPAWEKVHAYLEDVEGTSALAWVKSQNERSLNVLEKDSRFETLKSEIQAILESEDRLNAGTIRGGFLYHFLQDASHVRGLLRRAPLNTYLLDAPAWEPVLDMDALALQDGQSWVYGGLTCLRPDEELCLVKLSPGGSDASVYREFSLRTKAFVPGGFEMALAKQSAAWLDADTLLVGTAAFGVVTTSGYPRQIVKWKRGTPLRNAPVILEGRTSDMGLFPGSVWGGTENVGYVSLYRDFFHAEHWFLSRNDQLFRLPVPESAELHDAVGGSDLVVSLSEPWTVDGTVFPANAVLSVNLLTSGTVGALPTLILDPGPKTPVEGVTITRSRIWIQTLEDVAGKLWMAERDSVSGAWNLADTGFPVPGTLSVQSVDFENDRLLVAHEGFAQAPTLYDVKGQQANVKIKQLQPKFKDQDFVVDQKKAKSKDGTLVNYFVVRSKTSIPNGQNPTLLYGYGGFKISMTPSYLGATGKAWLERGGVYVLANIRGGGEYGADWHRAALKENRQRAFDDFIAVAEDLIATGITSPRHLGIRGGSNGGLLVGVAMTQRPDLFNAVVCEVPLLDMLIYTRLLAGASWVGEYGDPADPQMAEIISKYSPYQNLREDRKYPVPFFITSTKDDRVHPAHARRMAAKMEAFGHSFYYFENTEGGHAASANLKQRAHRSALTMVYLLKQLAD